MKELSKYIKNRIEGLKKTDGLITLSFFILGVIIGTWKYGLEPTISTVFILFSAILFAEFISIHTFYASTTRNKVKLEKGRRIFTFILLTITIIIQALMWNKFITIYSLIMGITFGLIMFLLYKFR